MLKIAVLGAGFMGGTHARAFNAAPNVKVVGVSGRTAAKTQALADEVGARAVADPLELIHDPTVDAVSITLPSNLHKEYTVAALEASKPVFVEKPMALSVAECDAMIAVAQRTGKLLMVAQVLRFWPDYIALKKYLDSGEIGRPLSAKASRLLEPPGWSEWFEHPEWTGGEVLDLHVHDLDALNWLFGKPQSIFSLGQRSARGGWDHALSLVDYGGVKAFAEGSAIMPSGYPFTMTLWVTCERGTVEFTFRAGGVQVDSRDTAATNLVVHKPGGEVQILHPEPGDGYANECAEFARCVSEGRAPVDGTMEQGRLAVQTALAARASMESGRVVTL